MSEQRIDFFFDPVCPFCWVTARWVRSVESQRLLRVNWRPLSLKMLNEPIGYEGKPAAYPEAHQRGLEMLRVVAAARAEHGVDVVGELYRALGEAVWDVAPPAEESFEAVLASTASGRDLEAVLEEVGLPRGLAEAAHDPSWDAGLRSETEEAVQRAGGGVGTPILSFDPPDGPALFGPVIDSAPDDAEAVRLWDAVETLTRWPGFAELKRTLRSFPETPLSSRIAGQETQVR
ncbi:DsbA family protein [Actinopolyspora sp. H202]|uniref:mycothiol-dependent nitroreductase Rv2466c family protein n=1 Tax=Actinopolyspora sp. H202 TaxID=1500456 RepID=UPI003EE70959